MANKKMLPREVKMKQEIESLRGQVSTNFYDIEELRRIKDALNSELRQVYKLLHDARDKISDLEDFKTFARIALPHLEPKREMLAVNTANREDTQER